MAKIAVVGAGMGGLAFASAMRNSQHEVVVFEQARELTELGAGISLWSNGTRLFEEMGIAEAMAGKSCETEVFFFRNEDGSIAGQQLLARDGWYRRTLNYPYYGAFRADLQSAMLDQVGRENIRLGKQLARLDNDGERPILHWTDGTTDTADLVIGADGVRSIVRSAIDPDAKPSFTGNSAFRGMAKTADLTLLPEPHSITDWMGNGHHLLNFPISKDFEYQTIVIFCDGPATWDHEAWRVPSNPDELRAKFEGWHPAIAQMLDHVVLDERWGLFQVKPLKTWYKNRAVLIGDAAHSMLPHHGQGAISSFEDAIALAHVLNNDALTTFEAKLQAYEAERKSRAERIQAESARANVCLHLPPGPKRDERNALLNTLPDHFTWLHGYKMAV